MRRLDSNEANDGRANPQGVTRRKVLAATVPAVAGLVGASALRPGVVLADGTPGARMLDRASRFLAGLEPGQRESATFPFEGRRRRAWNFMLGSRKAPGLALEDMSEDQKVAAMELLATALGDTGLLKAERIMLQQDILRDEWGKGSPDRNRERFSVQIYGTPSATDPWGWRFEGHHLSLTFTLVGDQVVSVSPMSFSSEPNPVPSGPHKGMVVLEEEKLGRDIFAALSPAQRDAALIQNASFGNILSAAGREERVNAERRGIALADLPRERVDDVMHLIEVFSVDNLVPALADIEAVRIREGDLMGARFGWAGDDRSQGSIYYRIHGDAFLIEFATLRNQPLHHHAVRHDLAKNFGDHVL
ncbi:MAG: DUF3500 domain-containing protein [Pseudomonadota bacterium]